MSSIGRSKNVRKATKATRKGNKVSRVAKAMGYKVPRTSSIRRTTSGAAAAAPANYENNSQSLLPIDPTTLTMQMRNVLTAIPEHPDDFERFSDMPLEEQIRIIHTSSSAGGSGQKGGTFENAINGFVRQYITKAWEKAHDSSDAAKNYVSDIAVNYMDKIQTLATGAGLSGPNAQQNLRSILYGLTVLAAAWNLGFIQMIPGLTLYLINILGLIATNTAALLRNEIFQNVLTKMTAVAAAYRYRDIPIGAYGVFAGATTPIFTAIYARGDQAFQEAFPDFGENIAAGGAAQLQELKETLVDKVQAGKAKLQATVDAAQPGIAAIKGVGTAWRNYLNESIQKFINGLAQAQSDMDAIIAYYRFLEDVGQQAQAQGVVIPEETAAEIADLIPVEVNNDNIRNNIVTGAVAVGTVISDENDIDANEAAELLLALGNIGGNGNGNVNIGPASAPAPETNYGTAFTGGKARRRRHRKTAKKSHKKKHTKKQKRKTTKGKKSKKSKRHTKRRSHKGGAHGIHH